MRDSLRQRGLAIDGVHIEFLGHRRSTEPRWKIYVTQLPAEITKDQICSAFREFGDIRNVQVITKSLFGKRFDTRDRFVIFKALTKDIPSYVKVRGWNACVKYDGQPKTCRLCGLLDHLAKDCPTSLRRKLQQNQNKDDEMPHEPEPDLTEEEITSRPSMLEEEPHVFKPAPEDPGQPDAFEEILENLSKPQEPFANAYLANVTVEDCQISSTLETDAQEDAGKPDKQNRFKPGLTPLMVKLANLVLRALRSLKKHLK